MQIDDEAFVQYKYDNKCGEHIRSSKPLDKITRLFLAHVDAGIQWTPLFTDAHPKSQSITADEEAPTPF